jgi:methylmalonyl-CoA epimerase
MKLDHIGIACRSVSEKERLYRLLGFSVSERMELPANKVKASFLPIGATHLELLEGMGEDSPVSKFIESRGEGIHHICIEVEDIEGILKELTDAGLPLIDEHPRTGAHGRIAFVHPKGFGGVLIELLEPEE